ncbi:MAG: copper resistance CopC family protein [Chloroflexota bacterium]
MIQALLMRRVAVLVLVASLAVLLLPGFALGHAELETATPADKSSVTEPVAEVSGIYSEAMTPNGGSLVVKDASGTVVARGTVDPEDDTRMVAIPPAPLGDGAYTVESTSVATDGHIEHATWMFAVALVAPPSLSAPVTAGPSAPPTAAPSVVASHTASAPSPVPSAGGDATENGGDVLLPIIVALIILGAGAAYLFSRRSHPPDLT